MNAYESLLTSIAGEIRGASDMEVGFVFDED
jgi:hypothetical protein